MVIYDSFSGVGNRSRNYKDGASRPSSAMIFGRHKSNKPRSYVVPYEPLNGKTLPQNEETRLITLLDSRKVSSIIREVNDIENLYTLCVEQNNYIRIRGLINDINNIKGLFSLCERYPRHVNEGIRTSIPKLRFSLGKLEQKIVTTLKKLTFK